MLSKNIGLIAQRHGIVKTAKVLPGSSGVVGSMATWSELFPLSK